MLSRTAAVFAAAGIVLASPLAAAAAPMTDPVDLGGAYVYDSTGVVGTDSAAVTAALDELYESTRSQLFVVIVDQFTGAADDQSWVDTSAELSGLGDADALLAIAVDDRTFRWSVSESPPGYRKISHSVRKGADDRVPVEHFLFSDGLATISVYGANAADSDAADVAPAKSHMGALNVMSRVIDGHQVTVVGEVPVAAVEWIAQRLQLTPAEDSASAQAGPVPEPALTGEEGVDD